VNPVAVIMKKRDGGRLAAEEIGQFIEGFVRGDVPEYQMSALAMAIYFRGMDAGETAALVDVMLRSGAMLQWPAGFGTLVDKHSTGGIGDKTSLVIAPLLACCGLKLPMISGRGLGATGGTLDKLESIPGFRTNLTTEEIRGVVDQRRAQRRHLTDRRVRVEWHVVAVPELDDRGHTDEVDAGLEVEAADDGRARHD